MVQSSGEFVGFDGLESRIPQLDKVPMPYVPNVYTAAFQRARHVIPPDASVTINPCNWDIHRTEAKQAEFLPSTQFSPLHENSARVVSAYVQAYELLMHKIPPDRLDRLFMLANPQNISQVGEEFWDMFNKEILKDDLIVKVINEYEKYTNPNPEVRKTSRLMAEVIIAERLRSVQAKGIELPTQFDSIVRNYEESFSRLGQGEASTEMLFPEPVAGDLAWIKEMSRGNLEINKAMEQFVKYAKEKLGLNDPNISITKVQIDGEQVLRVGENLYFDPPDFYHLVSQGI